MLTKEGQRFINENYCISLATEFLDSIGGVAGLIIIQNPANQSSGKVGFNAIDISEDKGMAGDVVCCGFGN